MFLKLDDIIMFFGFRKPLFIGRHVHGLVWGKIVYYVLTIVTKLILVTLSFETISQNCLIKFIEEIMLRHRISYMLFNCLIKYIFKEFWDIKLIETISCNQISYMLDCLIEHIFKNFWDIEWIEIIMIEES